MSASCNRRPLAVLRRRRGYTLLELIITMSTGAMLLAGLSSTLYIATKTLTPDATATSESNRSSLALAQIVGDLRLALSFSERTAVTDTATAATFTVPDRTGDGAVDTIRYSWSGTEGDPLVYQFNGGAAVTLISDVKQFKLPALTRSISATPTALAAAIAAYSPPPEGRRITNGTSVSVAKPTGLVPGNLMIAAVAVDGNVASTMTPPSGWTLITRQADTAGAVSFGVWWKVAGASEASNFAFTWTGSEKAYAWIMRFSGVEPSAPINAWSSVSGASALASPTSPNVTTTVDDAMIVRIGGFDGNQVNNDNPGIVGYTALTADYSDTGTGSASGAAAYATQSSAGAAGSTTFLLLTNEEYVTVTLALRPDDGI